MTQIKADNYFAIVPEWVIERATSRGVHLYAVLRRFADKDTLEAWPSRKTLATWMNCSIKTVDRALKNLEGIGAVHIERRFDDSGDPTTNLYTVISSLPSDTDVPTPRDTGVSTGGDKNDIQTIARVNQSHMEPELASPHTNFAAPTDHQWFFDQTIAMFGPPSTSELRGIYAKIAQRARSELGWSALEFTEAMRTWAAQETDGRFRRNPGMFYRHMSTLLSPMSQVDSTTVEQERRLGSWR